MNALAFRMTALAPMALVAVSVITIVAAVASSDMLTASAIHSTGLIEAGRSRP